MNLRVYGMVINTEMRNMMNDWRIVSVQEEDQVVMNDWQIVLVQWED